MKRIFTLVLIALMLAVGVNAAFEKVNTYNNNFSDVKDTNWFAENVKTAYELGFMNGKAGDSFDPNGNVTVAEGITMASRLHAIYNGTEVTAESVKPQEYRVDFDSMKNIGFNRALGETKDGVLVCKPDAPNSIGNYDPGVYVKELNLDAKKFNKLTFRMKRDVLPNTNPDAPRREVVQVYFETTTAPAITADKCVSVSLNEVPDLADWFEVEVELGTHQKWSDVIRQIRFDPTDNNGVYYLDYIVFSKSSKISNAKWYDMYVDYAVENGIVDKDTYGDDDYSRNITRAELCDLFAAALPEEHFAPVNDIKGIPDVMRDEKNADVYLMLYKAGVLLGSDEEGTFNPKSDIKRSEVAAIICRTALAEKRVKGTISADWKAQGNEYDIEFDNESYLESLKYEAESVAIKNGALVLKALDRGPDRRPQYDPKITVEDINIDAAEYSRLKVRMKVDFEGNIDSTMFDFYFTTEDEKDFSEKLSMHQDFVEFSYIDPAGWYVMEVDLSVNPKWSGNITSFRFDPANTNGTYTIDYIRFVKADYLHGASHEKLLSEGYTATRLLQDEGFENGFYVMKFDQTKNATSHGKFVDYVETGKAPLWGVAPYWSTYDLWENRDTTTDKYTLKDTYGVNTLVYNPEEKSMLMRLNATKIYNGQPHDPETYKWWPHLLIDQKTEFTPIDKKRNSLGADRMFVEADVRLLDFKDTINPEGKNVCSYFIYFYFMTDKAPGQRIWFGLTLFNGLEANDRVKIIWSPDSAANQYMYGMPQTVVFGNLENTFNPAPGVATVGEEWKKIRLDVTPHINRAVEWANRDNIFGVPVTVEDMYISGANIGFEVHGNYDCTFEIKNCNFISYNK